LSRTTTLFLQTKKLSWYCRRFQESVTNGFLDPELVFSRVRHGFYEQTFESPHAFEVWCAASGRRIIGGVFFKETKNKYLLMTSNPYNCYLWWTMKGRFHVKNQHA